MASGFGNVGANLRDFRNFSRDVKSFVGERDGYNMIFAPFTGLDKYDKCVTFAAFLLSHENIEDYTWAFDHFVKAMGRNPVVILTDQCPAMKVIVHNSFSDKNGLIASKHRLCMWHIMQKFRNKLGNRLCKETDFMKKMKTYIWSSILETDEFERGWMEVLKEFKLDEHKWISDMYSIRSSWIPSFFRDEPMFGLMRTTSRTESENLFFGQFHRQ
ncbi:protein FAR1-RELATED SEQUENCE 5-like [Apium graveolens]|uniref:protein FAR1-RELATED SEQUENCE 5-like n=1 Tax=Apium graveolens TaxID=4045 RepID=UPI003D7B06ED